MSQGSWAGILIADHLLEFCDNDSQVFLFHKYFKPQGIDKFALAANKLITPAMIKADIFLSFTIVCVFHFCFPFETRVSYVALAVLELHM